MPILKVPSSELSTVHARSAPRRKRPLVHLATRIFETPLAILPQKLDVILQAIGPRLGLTAEPTPVVAFYDDENDSGPDDNYTVQDGVAIVPVVGTLVSRGAGISAMSGITSYETLSKQFNTAMDDPTVKAICFDLDSPGGEVPGMLELSDSIYQARGTKPIVAMVNDCACSAAYCIASAADKVIVTRTAVAGSVGCFVCHCDQSGADKMAGVKYTYVFAGKHKVDGNSHEPLSQAAKTELQDEVDRIRILFAQTVARNRGTTPATVLMTEARVCYGAANVPLFADGVGSCDDVLGSLAALPARTSYSVPAAQGSRRLLSGSTSYLPGSGDAAGWLRAHSNMTPHVSLHSVAERFMAGQTAMRAKYGQSAEARLIAFPTARADAAGVGRRISMLVVPYGGTSVTLGGFVERYAPGSFRDGLSGDCRALFGHDEQKVIGRVSAGTARFWEDRAGVHCEADGPAAGWFDDLIQSMRRRDITGASAGFFITQHHWETSGGQKVRVVDRAILRDASIVSFPAYESATANVVPGAALPGAAETAALRARLKYLQASTDAERTLALKQRAEALRHRS